MEWLIIIGIGLLCGVGSRQINSAIEERKIEQAEKARNEFVIRDVQIKPCPKINGITVCGKVSDI